MFFKIGKVVSSSKNYIIFESNYTGHIVYVSKPNDFEKNKVIKIYTYVHRNEFSKTLYGFKTFKERILFDDLLSIPGIGPKSAISLLQQGANNLINAIANKKVDVIKSAPYIGERTASMLIFELSDKYQKFKNKGDKNHYPLEIAGTLKTLGFKKEQIDVAIKNIKPNESVEVLIEEAIKFISNASQLKTTEL